MTNTNDEHPALKKMREREARAVAQGYTKGDVSHNINPLIGHLRLALSASELLTTVDMEHMVRKMTRAVDAEIAFLHDPAQAKLARVEALLQARALWLPVAEVRAALADPEADA